MCKHGQTKVLHLGGGQIADVDICIYDLVAALNAEGFATVACCCGHGNRPGNIALADGRELIIAPDYESGRRIDAAFPDIWGAEKKARNHDR